MSRGPTPSPVMMLYYGFLLLSTSLTYGRPYPLFGVVLTGAVAQVALVVDCLLLIHILIGIARAQQLTWYLLLAYNGFNLASLAATLVVLDDSGFSALLGMEVAKQSLYTGLFLSALAMLVATVYAVRFRGLFWNRDPYLF